MPMRIAVLLASCFGFVAAAFNAVAEPHVTILSSRADTVSGGAVLLQIRADKVRVTLNGHDVSGDFHPGPQSNTLLGLVGGLRLGSNTLRVGGADDITLVNHPISGPVFSGPHDQPSYCR